MGGGGGRGEQGASIAYSAFWPPDQSDGPKYHLRSHVALILQGHLHREIEGT